MKTRFLLSFLFFTLSFTVFGQVELTFEKEHIDLGAVKKGEVRQMEFKFVNTGKEAIKINQISACECTTLDWPKTKILPGESGVIQVVFDSNKKDIVETIDVDIYLDNLDKKTGAPIFKFVSYSYSFM